ncbi:MAG: HD domain-containing protein [Thermoproteota archaeon]
MGLSNRVISECREYSRKMVPRDLHHGFDHILRVRGYALTIGKREDADLRVVEISSYLHDVGRGHEVEGEYHTVTSVRLARQFLSRFKISKEEIEKVTNAIECHSRKKAYRKKPRTLETEVIYDADGLDMIGAVGMLRMGYSAVLKGRGWDHVLKKARWRLQILNDFLTETGRMMAKRREKLVKDFIHQLLQELDENVTT